MDNSDAPVDFKRPRRKTSGLSEGPNRSFTPCSGTTSFRPGAAARPGLNTLTNRWGGLLSMKKCRVLFSRAIATLFSRLGWVRLTWLAESWASREETKFNNREGRA